MLAINGATSSGSSPVMVQCFTSDEGRSPYVRRIEKVKFGVSASEAFSHDIPATLLVLLLRVNKLGPLRKDIWRAPGNQAHVRKLIHIMQHGRLVNIEHFSIYTAASVIKKFLSKLNGGIFGADNEQILFGCLEIQDPQKRREAICRVLSSLSVPCQHLLVLLFGTFRLITDAADTCGTRMSPEAIGLSVAPSLFHTCIHNGHRARLEDVIRFRTASRVVTFVVENFGFSNLFPRENYEFYARITGRTLRVEANWHFSFHYPSNFNQFHVDLAHSAEGGAEDAVADRKYAESNSEDHDCLRPLGFAYDAVSLDELKELNRSAATITSSAHLDCVHERQTLRMQTRSEWFLSPILMQRDTISDDLYSQPLNATMSKALPFGRSSKNRPEAIRRRSFRSHYVRPASASSLLFCSNATDCCADRN
uniref:Rho-GAP domain-containing protein n=1 Tax=Trichuris muris TaxID=70415 RepID=A0A5S6QE76_TRIMR